MSPLSVLFIFHNALMLNRLSFQHYEAYNAFFFFYYNFLKKQHSIELQ